MVSFLDSGRDEYNRERRCEMSGKRCKPEYKSPTSEDRGWCPAPGCGRIVPLNGNNFSTHSK